MKLLVIFFTFALIMGSISAASDSCGNGKPCKEEASLALDTAHEDNTPNPTHHCVCCPGQVQNFASAMNTILPGFTQKLAFPMAEVHYNHLFIAPLIKPPSA